jgi:di/tricarboxylate transporter
VGGVTALAGVVFVALIGWRLVPAPKRARVAGEDLFDIDDYLAEARIPEDCELVGKSLAELERETEKIDAQVVGLVRDGHRFIASPGRRKLRGGDVLAVEASPQELDRFVNALGLELTDARGRTPGEDGGGAVSTGVGELVEAVVAPRSRLEGRTAMSQRLPRRFGVHLLGVSRQGRPHRNRLARFRFRLGDVLLLYGESDRLPDALTRLGCLPLAGRDISFGRRGDARPQVAIFACAIALASFGVLPIPIALGLAVAVMVAANLIPLRDLYEGVDWPVIVLLGALIPVGGALETTETTDLIAGAILALTAGLAPALVLALILVVTMTLSDVLNNAATAVVMAPIAVGIAEQLGTATDPFLMAVAVGASCAFLTPIGHQNNALIMGAGGYGFGDYWRMGLPLEVLIVLVSVPMILLVWPL